MGLGKKRKFSREDLEKWAESLDALLASHSKSCFTLSVALNVVLIDTLAVLLCDDSTLTLLLSAKELILHAFIF